MSIFICGYLPMSTVHGRWAMGDGRWTMDDGRWTTILPEMVTVNRFARTVFDHSRDCPHHSRKARSSLFIIRTRMASTLAMPSKMNELDLPIISVISSKLTRDNKK